MLFLLCTTACNKSGQQSTAADTIKVGEFASLTGSEASFGQASHKGTQLGIDEVNAAGGVLGKKIDLVYDDDQSVQGQAATIVRKLITRDNVIAVLGEVASGRSLEAAPICQQFKIPQISPSSTNPKVTEMGDYIFRVCFIDPFQGTVMAKFAKDTLKAKRVAVLSDAASAYSDGLQKYFKEKFTGDGGEIVADQKYSSGDKDFKAQLTTIKAANPDAIFIPGYYNEVGLIVLQARQLGITVSLFGGDGWQGPPLIQIAGDALKGCYFSTHYSPDDQSPVVQAFVKKYQAKYDGETPDAMAALGYDSAMILADAIKRAGTTESAKLRDAIAATRDFPGVSGKTTLDEHRNATKAAVIMTIKDGKFQYVETINP